MERLLVRAAAGAALSALAGAAALVAAFAWHPTLHFEMDGNPPGRVLTGFYPVEVSSTASFAWIGADARLNVPGLDRRSPWRCAVWFRGSRGPELRQPVVSLAVDGQVRASRTATNEFEAIEVAVPARAQPGVRLELTSSETFVPAADPRQLGVQIDRLACVPGGLVLPPTHAIFDAAVSAGVFAAVFGLVLFSTRLAVAASLAIAALQAIPMASGIGPYSVYADRVVWLAVWIGGLAAAGALIARVVNRPLSAGARFAVAFSAAILFIKLIALLHPSKPIIDAVFHAHRLDDVIGGRYFFTQPTGGVAFPYAIALYVFAAPWASLTRDHVALLRVVVSASEAVAGLMLFAAVLRWRDATAAAIALVLFHLLPASFSVIGNANLTNAFGQSAAVMAGSALILLRLGSGDWWQVLALALLAAVAMLSHVSTFALLAAMMAAAVVVFRWRGGPALTASARGIALALLMAAAGSIALYYGRPEFYDAYRNAGAARPAVAQDGEAEMPAGGVAALRRADGTVPTLTMKARVMNAVSETTGALGVPIVVLAAIGLWRTLAERASGRLMWTVAAWAAATVVFVAFGIVAPSRAGQQRYAIEFIVRAVYAGSPAALVLAGCGAAWGLRRDWPGRVVAGAAVLAAVAFAARVWTTWMLS